MSIEIILTAALVAAAAGVLGCFVVWRKMAYFGDSLSHSAMLGMALGMAAGIGTDAGMIAVFVLFTVLLTWAQGKKLLANDTILGIFAHAGLSLGMVAFALIHAHEGHEHEDHGHEHELLFGNLAAISGDSMLMMVAAALAILVIIWALWGRLVLCTISEDIARAEGINSFYVHLALVGMVAFTVAASVEMVGIFLITALMIIPAAAGRQLARTPKQMAGFAAFIGIASVLAGSFAAENVHIPAGPAIVVAATVLLILAMVFKRD